ncbi:hypothetical protein CY34DRAFT_810939 [Suillus luteus UH-Slu-Lm8-n1]|uniref:Uncharacterized protein n=1 Tax=Suillus luteus UH-Slu-Lm8-n1 TaxID=930992 RepID=A0A0D0ARB2_9AGAM|nr:hypothetical protein CY34DRAFT_810939 [Suillus luteus UH-Slu-Lm8-n1]
MIQKFTGERYHVPVFWPAWPAACHCSSVSMVFVGGYLDVKLGNRKRDEMTAASIWA